MNYRQVHLDFHTSEKIEGIGKNFNKTEFQQALIKGHVNSITLFAKWSANKYKIVFDKNGATHGKMSTISKLSYGKKYKLPNVKYKRSGYRFIGWSTSKKGPVKYKNKASIKNLISKNGDKVTLYARWKRR